MYTFISSIFGIYHIMRWQKEREQITVPSAEAEGIQLITFKEPGHVLS